MNRVNIFIIFDGNSQFFRENIENIYFRGENGMNDMNLLHVTIVTSTIT